MKRLTSIFLALALVLTLVPTSVFAATEKAVFSDVNSADYYAQAAEALAQIDVLEGYPDGTFGAEKTVTRAEMAAVVCRMIDKEEAAEAAKGETAFDDVDSDHWASGYINVASDEGIINGDGNGKFRPEDNVKYEEAIKMVVCALGYGDDVEVDANDWSKGYLDVAAEKGIAADLKGSKGEAATRGDIAVMSYNGLVSVGAIKKPVVEKPEKTTPNVSTVPSGTGSARPATYYLSFADSENGSVDESVAGGYAKNSAVTLTATPDANYEFVKWESNNGGTFADETSATTTFTMPAKNVVITAVFAPADTETYTVSFDLNYDGATGAPADQVINEGGKVTLPEEPAREGYTFTGWATTSTGETMWNFSHFVTESMTLYAIWANASDISLDTPDADVEIYSFNTDAYDILVGTAADVTFTAEIFANVELSATDVAVVDETGALLGYMNDEGTDGDETADDGIWTLKQTFDADAVKNTLYHVVAKDVASETINIAYYRIYTEQEFDAYESVVEQLDNVMAPFVDSGNNLLDGKYDEAIENIEIELNSLIEDEVVSTYTVNGNSIDITLKDGLLFAYVISEAGKEGANGNCKIITYEPYKDTWGDWSDESTDSADGSAMRIVNELNNYTFSNNVDLEDVNLENLKNMGGHQVIIWRGHGGYDTVHGSLLYTGIEMTRDLFETYKETYSADISSRRIKLTSSSCAITGGFIKTYVSNLDGALVWMGGCETGRDMIDTENTMHSLAQSFIDKGATAVIGTNKSVYTHYSSYFAIDVFKGLLKKDSDDQYYTLEQAFEFAINNNGNDDGHGARFLIFPQNDQNALNYRLYNEATGSISGKVMSADNSTNINNALVRVYQNNNLIKSVRTDAQGNYEVDLPAGDYIVKITAGNYKSAKMAVTVVEDTVTYNETFLLVQIGDEIGYANGTITNALNAQAVSDVTVKVRGSWNNQTGSVVYSTTTNDAGYYEIEYTPGLYTIEFSKDGFITGYKNIVVGVLGIFAQNAIISPVMSDVTGEYRFVLSWRERPNDLDSHLTGPLENTDERFHLYYPLKDVNGPEANPYREYATLDWDNVEITVNPAPETVTLHKQIPGVYRYSVHDYTNGGFAESTDMANSSAKVDVYKGSILVGTYHVPNIPGTIWTVFELSGDEFTPINRVGNGDAHDANLYSLRPEAPTVEEEESNDESTIVTDYTEKE